MVTALTPILLQAFAFEDQLASELRREELERERRECDQVQHPTIDIDNTVERQDGSQKLR